MKGQEQIANDKAQESTLIARLPRFRDWPIDNVDPSDPPAYPEPTLSERLKQPQTCEL